MPTITPVTAANNEGTTQPPPNTAPLVSSFSPAQTIVGDTPAVDSQPATSSDIVCHEFSIRYHTPLYTHIIETLTPFQYTCTYNCNSCVLCCVAVCVGNKKKNSEVVWASVSFCRQSFVNNIHQLWCASPTALGVYTYIYVYAGSFPHF